MTPDDAARLTGAYVSPDADPRTLIAVAFPAWQGLRLIERLMAKWPEFEVPEDQPDYRFPQDFHGHARMVVESPVVRVGMSHNTGHVLPSPRVALWAEPAPDADPLVVEAWMADNAAELRHAFLWGA